MIKISVALLGLPSILRDILAHSLSECADLDIQLYDSDPHNAEYFHNPPDVIVMSATSVEAEDAARRFIQSWPNCCVIAMTADGRSAWMFKSEFTRECLDEPTAATITKAIRVLAGGQKDE